MRKILFVLFGLCFLSTSAQFKRKNYKHIMESKSIYEIDAFLRDAHEDDPRRGILKKRVIKLMKEYIKNAHPADPRVKDFKDKIAILNKKASTKITFEEMSARIKKKKIEEYKAKLKARIQAGQQNQGFAQNQKPSIRYQGSVYRPGAPSNVRKNTAGTDQQSYVDTDVEQAATSVETVRSRQAKQRNIYARRGSRGSSSSEEEFNRLMSEQSIAKDQKTLEVLNKLFDNDPSSKDTIVLIENKSDCNIVVVMEKNNGEEFKLPIPANNENTIVIPKGDYILRSNVCGGTYSSEKTINKSLIIALNNPS
ncbi:MAG: hypothetical protein CSA38_03265 [Flavobacteriales bacterium]|nr:MAG: hypothetical protein CSA38_03265 [Flavobacteriales bacterium]